MSKSPSHIDDEALAAMLQQNPREAVGHIIHKYGGAMYSAILKIAGSQEIAKDLFQDATVKIWQNANKFDASKGKLFTWVFSIARNTAIDKVRTGKFKAQQTSKTIDETVYNNVALSEEMKMEDVGLRRTLFQLDKKYRDIVDLLYLQGYTQREAVDILGIPLGTLKTRAKTAIRELRRLLHKEKL